MNFLLPLLNPLTLFSGFSILRRMSESPSPKIISAIATFLRPVARILLSHGVSYRHFDQIARRTFVEVASEDYGVRGRPTNASRVAIMTGLTRKEVKSIRDDLQGMTTEQNPPARTTASEVLHVWFTDDDFSDSSGSPRELQFVGNSPSFTDLVRACAGDLPAGAMRAELKRLGAVREMEDGSLIPRRRAVVPDDPESRILEGLTFGLAPLAETIAFNSKAADRPRFQRVVHSERIDASKITEVTESIFESLVAFSEDLDTSLTSFEVPVERSSESKADLGVGMYFFVRNDGEG